MDGVHSYIVMRNMQRSVVADPLASGTRIGGRTCGPPELDIQVHDLDRRERAELLRDPVVVGVTPRMPTRLIVPMAADSDDVPSREHVAWGVAAVGAADSGYTGEGVIAAVLDTGIDRSHPAFSGVELIEHDFTDTVGTDAIGHGSHCAGILFGRDIRGRRIGVAPGIRKALVAKVLGDGGHGWSDMLFEGLKWAADAGAHVISMSLGFDFPGLVQQRTEAGWPVDLATSHALEAYRGNLRMFDAVVNSIRAKEAFGGGTVIVAAAGNESKRHVHPDYEIAVSLPAAADGVISVGALARAGDRLSVASFSNTYPVIAAPGVGIESAWPGGTTVVKTGTSMACPHVAGVAALWWQAVKHIGLPATPPTVLAKVRASARLDVFTEDVHISDRGVGLATAP